MENLQQDSNIKIEKLIEVSKEIEANGQSADASKVNIVLTAILHSENNILFDNLNEMILSNETSEMIKTLIAGIFMQKAKYIEIANYVNGALNKELILDETYETQEALLLASDSLVNAVKSDNEEIKEGCFSALLNLFIASCNSKSTAMFADTLLNRLINILPSSNDYLNNKLEEVVKNKELEINTRLVTIDILGRSKSSELFGFLESIILNLDEYTNNYLEKLYFLDVATKVVANIAATGFTFDYSKILKEISEPKLVFIAESIESDEDFNPIIDRIVQRSQKLANRAHLQN